MYVWSEPALDKNFPDFQSYPEYTKGSSLGVSRHDATYLVGAFLESFFIFVDLDVKLTSGGLLRVFLITEKTTVFLALGVFSRFIFISFNSGVCRIWIFWIFQVPPPCNATNWHQYGLLIPTRPFDVRSVFSVSEFLPIMGKFSNAFSFSFHSFYDEST